MSVPSNVTHTIRTKLQDRVLDWLRDNPTEQLTVSDVAVKFGVSQSYALNTISSMAASGLVRRQMVYRLTERTRHGTQKQNPSCDAQARRSA